MRNRTIGDRKGVACIRSYGEKGTHSSAIFGAVECFVPLTRSSFYLFRRDHLPTWVLPDSTEVVCQLRNESIIHLVQGNTSA